MSREDYEEHLKVAKEAECARQVRALYEIGTEKVSDNDLQAYCRNNGCDVAKVVE